MARVLDSKVGQESFEGLRRANRLLALVYLLQGVAILVLSKRAEVAITASYLTPDSVQSTLAGHAVLAPATHRLLAVNVGYVVAWVFVVAAAAYASMGTWWSSRYEADLKQGTNRARWVALGASFGLMIVAVAMLSGVYDAATLGVLFAATLAANVLGLVVERMGLRAKQRPGRLPFGLAVALGLVPLLFVGAYMWGAHLWAGRVPAYVVGAYATLFAGAVLTGATLFLQQRGKGKWANYAYAERMYMLVGLVVKTALVWQVFAGALKP